MNLKNRDATASSRAARVRLALHFVDYAARHKTLLHKTLLHKLTAPSGGWGNADNIQKVLRGQPGKQKQHQADVNDEAENCSARL